MVRRRADTHGGGLRRARGAIAPSVEPASAEERKNGDGGKKKRRRVANFRRFVDDGGPSDDDDDDDDDDDTAVVGDDDDVSVHSDASMERANGPRAGETKAFRKVATTRGALASSSDEDDDGGGGGGGDAAAAEKHAAYFASRAAEARGRRAGDAEDAETDPGAAGFEIDDEIGEGRDISEHSDGSQERTAGARGFKMTELLGDGYGKGRRRRGDAAKAGVDVAAILARKKPAWALSLSSDDDDDEEEEEEGGGGESPQGTAFTTRTGSYGNQSGSIERSVDRSIADGPAVGSFLRIEGRTGKRREAYERGNDTTTTTTTTTTT